MTQEDILTLHQAASYPAISIYLPTIVLGKDRQQNTIRYKNALRKIEKDLQKLGENSKDILEQLAIANKLLDDSDFWDRMQQGIAVFISPKHFSYFTVPFPVEEQQSISAKFYLTPLLPWLDRNQQFYLLSLSQENICLYQGTPKGIEPVEVPDMPTSFKKFTEDNRLQISLHTFSDRKSATQGGAMQHGYFDKDAEHKKDLQEMYHAVSRAVQNLLRTSSIPLILAGAEYAIPMFRESYKHNHIFSEDIPHNIDELHPDQILEKALSVLQPHIDKEIQQNITRILELQAKSPELIARSLEDILATSTQGKIDQLFLDPSCKELGTYTADTLRIDTTSDSKDSYDLFSFSALEVLNSGGTVHTIAREKLPKELEGSVAILRY